MSGAPRSGACWLDRARCVSARGKRPRHIGMRRYEGDARSRTFRCGSFTRAECGSVISSPTPRSRSASSTPCQAASFALSLEDDEVIEPELEEPTRCTEPGRPRAYDHDAARIVHPAFLEICTICTSALVENFQRRKAWSDETPVLLTA